MISLKRVLLLLSFFLTVISFQAQTVIFRCDDYGLDESNFYLVLLHAIEISGAKLTLGVVPMLPGGDYYSTSQDSILAILSEFPNVEIAQHGLSHKSWKFGSEFVGRPYKVQLLDIAKGKSILELKTGKQVTTFIPPFNSYDSTTAKAIQDLHFKTMSGGIGNPASAPINTKLNFIPSTISLRRFTKLVHQNKLKKNSIYIVLFHAYDFIENREFYSHRNQDMYNITGSEDYMSTDIVRFSELMRLLNKRQVIYRTVSELANQQNGKMFTSAIIRANKTNTILPLPKLLLFPHPGYLLIESNWIYINRNALLAIVFYLAMITLSFTVVNSLLHSPKNRKYLFVINLFVSLITATLLIISFHDGSLGYKALLLVTIYIGFNLAVFKRKLSKI